MSRERKKWEKEVLNSFYHKVKIVNNPINPSLYDLSGKTLRIIASSSVSRKLSLQQYGDTTAEWVDVCDCEPAE